MKVESYTSLIETATQSMIDGYSEDYPDPTTWNPDDVASVRSEGTTLILTLVDGTQVEVNFTIRTK